MDEETETQTLNDIPEIMQAPGTVKKLPGVWEEK